MKLDNKVVVVTGAATGLGRATAIGAAKEGAQLVLADIDEDGGEATAKLISGAGGTAHFVRTDLSQSADVRRLMDTVGEHFGHLDILINPAAILVDAGTRIDEYSEESWRRVIDVNLTGSFLLLKYAVPLLQQAGGGVVLLVISGAGVLGRQCLPSVRIEQRRRPRAGPGCPRTASSPEHPHPRRVSGRDGDEHEVGRHPRDG